MRLFPVALSLILVVTAVSVEIAAPFVDRVALTRVEGTDILLNILLYVPIGWALRTRGFFAVGAAAAALSLFSECVQLFYPDRYTSPIDVAANTAGALLGAAAVRVVSSFTPFRLSAVRLGTATGAFAALSCAAFLAVLSRPGTSADFSNWDPTHELAVGDEPSGNRLWHGTISDLAIFDDGLKTETIQMLAKRRSSRTEDLGRTLFEISGVMNESDSLWGQPLLEGAQKEEFVAALTKRSQLTVLVWFRGYDPSPSDTAHVVTFSKDPFIRNFTVALEKRRVVFRLRTPQTGPSGIYPQIITPAVVRPNRDVFVAATYDGRVTRVYVDGMFLGRVNLAAKSRAIPFLADSGLPTATFLTGMLAAICILSIGGSLVRRGRWVFAPLAALGGTSLFVFLGADTALPEFRSWVPLFGLAAGFVVAASTRQA